MGSSTDKDDLDLDLNQKASLIPSYLRAADFIDFKSTGLSLAAGALLTMSLVAFSIAAPPTAIAMGIILFVACRAFASLAMHNDSEIRALAMYSNQNHNQTSTQTEPRA